MSCISDTDISCGVYSLSGLEREGRRNIECIASDLFSSYDTYGRWQRDGDGYGERFAFIIWSDALNKKGGSNGETLHYFIKRTFGTRGLTRSVSARNPNSGNLIRVYTWRIPSRALWNWSR